MSDVLYRELRDLLGDRWVTSEEDRADHGEDASFWPAAPPDGVAYPGTVEEVRAIVLACGRHGVPLIPYGAGSSVEGATLATQGGVALDLTRMSRVLAIHVEDQDAVVEAGVTRLQLAGKLESTPLFFSVDPGADATLGGMASTRCSGTNTVRYGTIRENVLALQVVLADGRVIRTGSRARKSSAGYDLTRLFVGSEGTLGVITELTVKLHPKPEAISAAVCDFPAMHDAVGCVIDLLQAGLQPARVELLDASAIEAVNRHAGLDLRPAPTLFFEFHGSESGVAERAKRTQAVANARGGSHFSWAAGAGERDRLWRARHEAYYAVRALRPDAKALSTDICVPITALASCIDRTLEDREREGIVAPVLGHVGDGNVHFIALGDADDPAEVAKLNAFHARMVERALAHGGTCTGEHGVGLGKRGYLRAEHGEGVDVMRSLKGLLDPAGVFNPGKLFEDG